MYDTNKTKISLGVLIEVNEALRQYRDSFVLAGGWAPYFITKGHFNHCGSIDIDLVLKPKILRRYQSIRESLTSLGFRPTLNPFRFGREVAGGISVELDFLSEPEALENIPREFVRVQEGLDAVIILGSSIVFKFNFEAEASGRLTDGSELSTNVKVGDIVSMVGMKGHALGRPLKLEKDCYDVYAICGFTAGSPTNSAREFTTKFRRGRTTRREKDFVEEALERIGAYFRFERGRGPIAVSRFYGMDEGRRIDSYQRVSAFLEGVQ
ncbi:MAG: hypothetical protein HXX80_01725 [Nitrososphaerales archaeon]|nr:hypothetical protein [Nitrososphaerales archaeon]